MIGQSVEFDDPAILHGDGKLADVVDIRQRIGIEDEQVGDPAGPDGARRGAAAVGLLDGGARSRASTGGPPAVMRPFATTTVASAMGDPLRGSHS